jgi:hypothetical protein
MTDSAAHFGIFCVLCYGVFAKIYANSMKLSSFPSQNLEFLDCYTRDAELNKLQSDTFLAHTASIGV